jgi:hypothetical protein
MKIEKVNEPQWSITVTEKERQALEDIFGNMADCHLDSILGNRKLSRFILEFYELVHNT